MGIFDRLYLRDHIQFCVIRTIQVFMIDVYSSCVSNIKWDLLAKSNELYERSLV